MTTTTKKKQDVSQKELKNALKTFKFWYSVLLETEYMNDVQNRKDFSSALQTLKETIKQ